MKARQIVLPALAMAAIVLTSNLLVQFPLNAWLTWGAFSYPVAYLVTDVCNRVAGPSLARRVAWLGFATGLACSSVLAPVRMAVASGSAFIVSQLLDVAVFNRLRQSFPSTSLRMRVAALGVIMDRLRRASPPRRRRHARARART